MQQHCNTCHKTTTWKRKRALRNMCVGPRGERAFSRYDGSALLSRGVTFSAVGIAELVPVVACTECGRSLSAKKQYAFPELR